MSGWDAYVKGIMDRAPCIRKCAIIGDDGSVWAKTESFNISPEELTRITGLWNNINEVPTTGLHIESTKYIVPLAEAGVVLGKSGKMGIIAVKSQQTTIVAQFEGEAAEGQACRAAVEYTANYMKSLGY